MNIESLYAPVTIGATSVVGMYCTLGYPKEARIREEQKLPGSQRVGAPVVVGERCQLANQVVLYEGVSIGDNCVLEDRVRLGYNCTVGAGTRIVYGAFVCDRVTIGANAVVAGFICDGTRIGDRSTVMGELVHEYTRPHQDWWEVDEEPPIIEADTVVGFGARVVGGVRIGPRSYVAAGAVVTKDVPAEHVVTGVNLQTPAECWTGERLQGLIEHWRAQACRRP
ncbi:DapH/DapD/GlmU-related protein [Lentzea flava]|uniref:Acyltransferase n=1 Tax=Lentzea flava TaxID=103732 RepID=A0ABQ2UIT0_9PSEU|nr:DapH/DapD/GlmU-related protein [Lentzea flava]MCP2199986.1 Hexapeptide repeat of succinyl-transferase [Lentzea flava]GGU39515.1 acyltransferase [Lentzea flava]